MKKLVSIVLSFVLAFSGVMTYPLQVVANEVVTEESQSLKEYIAEAIKDKNNLNYKTIMALKMLGMQEDKKAKVKSLSSYSKSVEIAKTIGAIVANGENPRDYKDYTGKNYVEILLEKQDSNFENSKIQDYLEILMVLEMIKVDYDYSKALEVIEKNVVEAGDMKYIKTYPIEPNTAMAAYILSLHEDTKDDAQKMVTYLKSKEKKNGHFDKKVGRMLKEDLRYTEPCVTTFTKLKEDSKMSITDLKRFKAESNKSFNYNPGVASGTTGALEKAIILFATLETGKTIYESFEIKPVKTGSIELKTEEFSLEIGKTKKVDAIVKDSEGQLIEDANIVWEIENDEFASVDNKGNVEGKKVGKTKLIVKCVLNGKELIDTLDIEIKQKIAKTIEVETKSKVLEDESFEIKVKLYDESKELIECDYELTWEGEAFKKISKTEIKALKVGKHTLKVIVYKGTKDEISKLIEIEIEEKGPENKDLKDLDLDKSIEELHKYFNRKFEINDKETLSETGCLALRNSNFSVEKIDNHKNIYGTFTLDNTARSIIKLVSLSINPKDYTKEIIKHINKIDYSNERESVKALANTIIALNMLEETKELKEAKNKVKDRIISLAHEEDGESVVSFGQVEEEQDEYDIFAPTVTVYRESAEITAYAIIALSSFEDLKSKETVEKALNYIELKKGKNGLVIEGEAGERLLSTIAVWEALRYANEDIEADRWCVTDELNNKITFEDGILNKISKDGKIVVNSAKMTNEHILKYLSEKKNNNSIYDLKYTEKGKPYKLVISETDIKMSLGESPEVLAKAYDENEMPLKVEFIWSSKNPEIAFYEDGKIKCKNAGKTQIEVAVKNFEDVREIINITVDEKAKLDEETKSKLKNEVEFLKAAYKARGSYEFLAAPAAVLSGIDKQEVADNVLKYSRPTLFVVAKEAVARVSSGADLKREFEEGTVNLVEYLRASQTENGAFVTNEGDAKNLTYQAWTVVALDMANADYNRDLAIKNILELLNSSYEKEFSYKKVNTEAFVLIALSNHTEKEGVAEKIQELIDFLKLEQNGEAGFSISNGYFSNTPVAIGPVMQALIANDINPICNADWKVNGKTMFDTMLLTKYEHKNPRMSGYAKDQGKNGADYQSTYYAFGALVDAYNESSMFKSIRLEKKDVKLGTLSNIYLYGRFEEKVSLDDSFYLKPIALDDEGNWAENEKIDVEIDNEEVIEYKNNLITAKKRGKAEITFKSGDVSLTKTIQVFGDDVAELKMAEQSKYMMPNEEKTLKISAHDGLGNLVEHKQILWESSNNNVATVELNEGKITAVSPGTAIITAMLTENRDVKATFEIEVLIEKECEVKIRVEGTNKTLYNDSLKMNFKKTTTPFDVLRKAVGEENIEGEDSTYGYFLKGILEEGSEDGNGWSYAIKKLDGSLETPMVGIGSYVELFDKDLKIEEVILYKTFYDTKTYEMLTTLSKAEVRQIEDNIEVTVKSAEGQAIENALVEVYEQKHYTNENGKVLIPVKETSKVEIRISKESKGYPEIVRETLTFEVKKEIEEKFEIKINKQVSELKVGEKFEAEAKEISSISGETGGELVWSSSNEEIAKVDANGNIEALKAGKTTITVQSKAHTDVKASFKLTVKEEKKEVVEIKEAVEKVKAYLESKESWNYEVALAYRVLNGKAGAVEVAKRFEAREKFYNPTDYAATIIGLVASERNPYDYRGRNYVKELIALQQEDGSFFKEGGASTVNQTIYSVLALDMAGAKYNKESAKANIVSKQNEDGSVGFGAGDTAMMIVVLSEDKYKDAIYKADKYLNSKLVDGKVVGSRGDDPYSAARIINAKKAINKDSKAFEKFLMTYFEENVFKNGDDIDFFTPQAFLGAVDTVTKGSVFKMVRYDSNGGKAVEFIKIENKEALKQLEVGTKVALKAILELRDGLLKEAKVMWKASNNNVKIEGLELTTLSAGKTVVTAVYEDVYSGITLIDKMEINIIKKPSGGGDKPEEKHYAKISVKGPKGDILSLTKVEFEEGDNVLSLTKEVLNNRGISIEDRSGYVYEIGGIKERQYGAKSGWMVKINGAFPQVGAPSISVKDNMKIEWVYTRDLGKDVGDDRDYDNSTSTSNTQESSKSEMEKTENLIKSNNIKKAGASLNKLTKAVKKEDVKRLKKIAKDISKKAQKSNDIIAERQAKRALKQLAIEGSKLEIEKFSRVNGTNTEVDVDKSMLEKSIKTLNKEIEELKKEFDGEKIEKVIVVEVPKTNNDNMHVNIDKEAYEALKSENVESIEVRSEKASIKIPLSEVSSKFTVKLSSAKANTEYEKAIEVKVSEEENELSKFEENLIIAIPYNKELKAGEYVTVYCTSGDKEELMGGIYDKERGLVVFETPHLSKFEVKVIKPEFKDTENESIVKMAARGIITGYEDNTFKPDNSLTRAEFATLINKILKLKSRNTKEIFEDVNNSEWFFESVTRAHSYGIIKGMGDGTFKPNEFVTREQAAVMMERALKLRGFENTDSIEVNFKDEVASWSKTSIENLMTEEIFASTNKFRAKEFITRKEAAVALENLYEKILLELN